MVKVRGFLSDDYESCLTPMSSDVQAHIHISKLRGERGESYKIGKCPDSWNDQCHPRFTCIYCYTGTTILNTNFSFLAFTNIPYRQDLHCHHQAFLQELISSLILRDFIIVYWSFLKIQMKSEKWIPSQPGGTSEFISTLLYQWFIYETSNT